MMTLRHLTLKMTKKRWAKMGNQNGQGIRWTKTRMTPLQNGLERKRGMAVLEDERSILIRD